MSRDQWKERQDEVLGGDAKIVHHSRPGGLEPYFIGQPAIRGDSKIAMSRLPSPSACDA